MALDNLQKQALLSKINPVKFTDGKDVYKKYMDEYVVHEKGLFIFASSGVGKTHFVKNQKEKHWIDGDIFWEDTGAHPLIPWWTMGDTYMKEIDQRSDIATMYARKLGLWVMGASQNWLSPDGIVLPNWDLHQQQIIHREQNNYDGGAKSSDFEQVLAHRAYAEKVAQRDNVPIFSSIQEAVEALTKGIS